MSYNAHVTELLQMLLGAASRGLLSACALLLCHLFDECFMCARYQCVATVFMELQHVDFYRTVQHQTVSSGSKSSNQLCVHVINGPLPLCRVRVSFVLKLFAYAVSITALLCVQLCSIALCSTTLC
jgi:hypothetical protein